MSYFFFFFFNDTATTEIYTLSLHDALPIYLMIPVDSFFKEILFPSLSTYKLIAIFFSFSVIVAISFVIIRSEEHTSELQSRQYLVCRLLLEKKKTMILTYPTHLIPISSFII